MLQINVNKRKFMKIVEEETKKVISEQEGLSLGTHSQKMKDEQAELDKQVASRDKQKQADSFSVSGTEENPDYDPKLAEVIKKGNNAATIFNLAKGLIPSNVRELTNLHADFINAPGGKTKNWKLLFFAVRKVGDDIVAQARKGKGHAAPKQTIKSYGEEDKTTTSSWDKYIFRDEEVRQKMRQALASMLASFAVDPKDPNVQAINKKEAPGAGQEAIDEYIISEGNILSAFISWLKQVWEDIKHFVFSPVASSMAFVEAVIRSADTFIGKNITKTRKKCLAAAISFPDFKPSFAGPLSRMLPLGHGALIVIHEPESAKEGKGSVKEAKGGGYEMTYADFGRFGATSASGGKKEYELVQKKTRSSRNEMGTKRYKRWKLNFVPKWQDDGDLTNKSQILLIDSVRKSSLGKYAKESGMRVAWLQGVDPDKVVQAIKKFKIRPYGLYAGKTKAFGYVKDGKFIKANAMQVENCGTFVATCLAAGGGGSWSASANRYILVSPNDVIAALANEYDEEITTYGTADEKEGGVPIISKLTGFGGKIKKGTSKNWAAREIDAQDWSSGAGEWDVACSGCKLKRGSVISYSLRKKGIKTKEVYDLIRRKVPEKILKLKQFKGWDVRAPGRRTRKLIAIMQKKIMGVAEADGRVGPKTWGALNR